MYLNLGGLMAKYLNGYLGSIPSQDTSYYSISFFYFQWFVKELFGLSFYRQFLFYHKRKCSSNVYISIYIMLYAAMIFLR